MPSSSPEGGSAPGAAGSPASPSQPKALGQYRIEATLGQGGMGRVYRAVHETLGRPVALKILPPEMAAHPEFVARFLREAGVLAGLSHPHIVQVHDAGCVDGQYYIAMELVEGRSLAHGLEEKGPLAETDGLRYLRDAAEGLAAAHEQGLVHRDIKPENLLLDQKGRVRIADFGLALESEAATHLTTPGIAVGTPLYMSPEQIDGAQADARSDLYSLGATFYHLLTGHQPFAGGTVANLFYKHKFEAPVSPRQHRPELSANVANLLLRLLAKRRADRPQSAKELIALVDAAHQGRPVAAPAQAPAEAAATRRPEKQDERGPAAPPAQASSSRKYVVAALFVALVLLAVLGVTRLNAWKANSQRLSAALADARGLLERDQPDEALARLQKVVESVSGDTPNLGVAYELIGQATEQARTKRDREGVVKALTEAQKLLDKEAGEAAAAVIEKALASASPDAPRYSELQPLIEKARDLEESKRVRARYLGFARCLFAQDWEKCQAFVEPESRMKLGAQGIQVRLQLVLGLAKLLKLAEHQIRVQDVRFSKERSVAEVVPVFQVNNEWKEQAPAKWKRVGGEWYMPME